jgi:hypothetical protein
MHELRGGKAGGRREPVTRDVASARSKGSCRAGLPWSPQVIATALTLNSRGTSRSPRSLSCQRCIGGLPAREGAPRYAETKPTSTLTRSTTYEHGRGFSARFIPS